MDALSAEELPHVDRDGRSSVRNGPVDHRAHDIDASVPLRNLDALIVHIQEPHFAHAELEIRPSLVVAIVVPRRRTEDLHPSMAPAESSGTMCGFWSRAASAISRLNRSVDTPAAISAGSTLITTRRCRAVSSATNTRDIPPPPSTFDDISGAERALHLFLELRHRRADSRAWSCARSGSVTGVARSSIGWGPAIDEEGVNIGRSTGSQQWCMQHKPAAQAEQKPRIAARAIPRATPWYVRREGAPCQPSAAPAMR